MSIEGTSQPERRPRAAPNDSKPPAEEFTQQLNYSAISHGCNLPQR